MTTSKKSGKLVAIIPCEGCGRDQELRVSKEGAGFPYYSCPKPADGGCGRQTFTRDQASGQGLARKAKQWRSKADRLKWTGEEDTDPAPAKNAPAADTKPTDPPADPPKKESFLDRKIL